QADGTRVPQEVELVGRGAVRVETGERSRGRRRHGASRGEADTGGLEVRTDGVAARVLADAGEQMGIVAEAAERHGHVHGGAAGMLATCAVDVDDDVRECFSDDEECRGHRSIIAGFREGGDPGHRCRKGTRRIGSVATSARCGAVDAVRKGLRSPSRRMSGDNGGMHEADHETPEAPERTPTAFDEPATAPVARPETEQFASEPAAQPDGADQRLGGSAAQPKSAYELPSKKNTVLRNMVWALLLTMAVVVVVGIAFFGVGSEPEREPLANSELDVTASAERAEDVAPFPVAVPAVDEGWTERSARYTAGAQPRWTLEYTSPDGELITLIQESQLSAPMLSSAIPGSTVEEE